MTPDKVLYYSVTYWDSAKCAVKTCRVKTNKKSISEAREKYNTLHSFGVLDIVKENKLFN